MACCDGPDLLLASSGQRERKVRLAHTDSGLVDADFLLEVGIFKSRQQRALVHLLAFFDRQIDNAARHLEADQTLMRFNIAGERDLVCRRGLFCETRIEIHAGGNHHDQQERQPVSIASLHSTSHTKVHGKPRMRARYGFAENSRMFFSVSPSARARANLASTWPDTARM